MDAVPDVATTPTLCGRLVRLRPFRDGDAEVMAQIISDPEVRRLTGSVESTAEAERPDVVLDARLRDWYATRDEQADRLDLAVEDAATRTAGRGGGAQRGRPGGADLQPAGAHRPRRARAGARHRGGRLATAHGIERLGMRRITLEVFEFNPRAQRVYEKVGYRVTGVRPGGLVFDGVEVAALDMAVDAAHWRGFPAGRSG